MPLRLLCFEGSKERFHVSWAEYHVVSADDPRTETDSRSLSSDDPEMQVATRDGYAYNPPFHDSAVRDLALVPRRHSNRIWSERCCLTPGVRTGEKPCVVDDERR
jgi:hypothetical protein